MANPPRHLKKALSTSAKLLAAFGLGLFFMLLLYYSVIAVSNHSSVPFRSYVGGIAQTIGFILSSWLMYRWLESKKGEPLGWSTNHRWNQLGQGLVVGSAVISLTFLSLWATGGITSVEWQGSKNAIISGFAFIAIFGLVAVSEELFSRGYTFAVISRYYGTRAAVIMSSILFAALHAQNPGMWDSPLPILNLVLAGLFFALSRVVTGSLWFPIGYHFAWNWLQGCLFGFPVSGLEVYSLLKVEQGEATWLSGGAFGAEGSVLTTVWLLLAIVFVTKSSFRVK